MFFEYLTSCYLTNLLLCLKQWFNNIVMLKHKLLMSVINFFFAIIFTVNSCLLDPLKNKWLTALPEAWDMSDTALAELIELTISDNSNDMDAVAYFYLNKHRTVCCGCPSKIFESSTLNDVTTFLTDDVVVLTKNLLSSIVSDDRNYQVSKACVPWWATALLSEDLISISNCELQNGDWQIVLKALKSMSSILMHTRTLLEAPLFQLFSGQQFIHAFGCTLTQYIEVFLKYLFESITLQRAKIVMLLLEFSKEARYYVQSIYLPKICHLTQSGGEQSISSLQIVSKLLEIILHDSVNEGMLGLCVQRIILILML